ncbi:MAG TPA: tryptophan halogenase family protein [Steroidobacteraceae bacterium]
MSAAVPGEKTGALRRVVIAGGGTAGWIAAAALSQQLKGILDVTLIESEEIGTIGVGESSIPPMRVFHKLLKIDEQEFMRSTEATFKLGILFDNWRTIGDRYIHSFGRNGKSTWLCEFHHFWLRGLEMGIDSELGDYCFELQAAKAQKFATSPQSEINYAYHLDATVYGKFLRRFAEGHGAKRVEGKIKQVRQHPDSGFIEALVLESGQCIEGDFFIDCTGFRGLLIEQTLQTGYEDWSHWLPCDSAVPIQTESVGPPVPYTRAIAHEAGWRWRIPLQHRVGNGLVYCSRYMTDEAATEKLLNDIEGKTLIQPRVIRFKTGRRRQAWNKNCVALGLAGGFLEPLESTTIYVIMTGITRLMQLFPFNGVTQPFIDQYNEEASIELERIRDFIVLHYKATQREDSAFWRDCANMAIPDSLQHRIQMFKESAHAYQAGGELFRVDSWTQVMLGQGIRPQHYHHGTEAVSDQDLRQFLYGLKKSIADAVAKLPSHQDFIDRYCKANSGGSGLSAS